jgi:hypothetical protein
MGLELDQIIFGVSIEKPWGLGQKLLYMSEKMRKEQTEETQEEQSVRQ